jgi:hypothetical protein
MGVLTNEYHPCITQAVTVGGAPPESIILPALEPNRNSVPYGLIRRSTYLRHFNVPQRAFSPCFGWEGCVSTSCSVDLCFIFLFMGVSLNR